MTMSLIDIPSTPFMSSFQPFQPIAGNVAADVAPSQQHTTVFIPQATKAPAISNPTTIVTATDDVDTYASWSLQWVNNSKEHIWNVGNPQFKFCKKRKEFYSDDMPSVWYKAPYKYHMSLEVGNMDENEPVTALLDLQFEDGQKVVYSNKSNAKRSKKTPPSSTHELSSGVVSNNENTFTHSGKKSEVTIGPFTFNCCSYKFDGRKFRLVLYLINQHGVCCYLYSSPILIRAKKPIVNKGSKSKTNGSGKKRKHSDSEEETDSNDDDMGKPAPEKKQKLAHLQQQQLAPLHTIPSTMTGMPLFDAITQQPVLAIPAQQHQQQQQQPPSILLPQQNASLVSLMNGAGTSTNQMMMAQPIDMGPFSDASLSMFGPPSPTKWYQSSAFLGEHGLLFADKPLSGLEKVQTMIETFESMDDKDRKELMDKMFERASYPEREFIKRKYFTDTWESHPSSSTTTTTTTTTLSTNTSSHQQQQQQASTSSDVDSIFTGVMHWQ